MVRLLRDEFTSYMFLHKAQAAAGEGEGSNWRLLPQDLGDKMEASSYHHAQVGVGGGRGWGGGGGWVWVWACEWVVGGWVGVKGRRCSEGVGAGSRAVEAWLKGPSRWRGRGIA